MSFKRTRELQLSFVVLTLGIALLVTMSIGPAAFLSYSSDILPPGGSADLDVMVATWQAMVESLNAHNEDYLALLTDDIVADGYAVPPPLEGKEAVAGYYGALYQGFPDIHWEAQRIVTSADAEALAVQYLVTGTHLGVFNDIPPTGNTLQMPTFEIFEFEGGEIKKIICVFDNVSMMIQLGLMPAPELPELVPSFTLPDPEAPGLPPLEAADNLASVYNAHDLDSYAKLLHSDAEILIAPLGIPMGRDAFIAALELYFLAYSDLQQEIVRMIDMGDGWVLTEVVFGGTNDGPYFGLPATGKYAAVRGAWLARFDANGLMTNLQAYWDELTVMVQLGLFPPPAPPEIETGSFSFDTWLEIAETPEYTPEERADGLYLVLTTPGEYVGEPVFTFDATGNQVAFSATFRDEFEELKVSFDENGAPVSASGPSRGSAELLDANGNVAFYGGYMLTQTLQLAPDFTPIGASPTGYFTASGVGDYAGCHIWEAVEGSLAPNPKNAQEIGYAMSGRGAITKQIITSKSPTGQHVTEAWHRYGEDPEFVLEERPDGWYFVSTRPSTSIAEYTYIFDTGEEIAGNITGSVQRQELKLIFDESEVPVRAVGCCYGVTIRGSDSYGNVLEGVARLELSVSLSDDMKITGVTGEISAVTQVKGKFADYIGTDQLIITSEPDPDDPTKIVYHAVGTGVLTEVTGLSSVGMHSIQLSPGLNSISLPLKPLEPYTARSLAQELDATIVVAYDEVTGTFPAYTPTLPGDGFPIEVGKGYIVNVLKPTEAEFLGTIWGNVELFQAAPPVIRKSAWAFVVSGLVLDGESMSARDGGYILTTKNLRTGDTATRAVANSGYFAAAYADLSRKAVIEAGDKVEVAVIDSRGSLVSGPLVHEITLDEIRNAVLNVRLRLGDIIPEKSALLQNYPNPFNPETWIPYKLRDEAPVSIRIYDATGRLVRALDMGHKDAGIYVSRSKAAYWDGKNEVGEEVASGVYFYSITAGGLSATRKMVIRR